MSSIRQYTSVLQKLNNINLFRPGRLDLTNMKNMTNLIGNPQKNLKFIHIAGTNGKGSVTLKIQKILQAQGYKVGLYTSPHLFSFKERIIVNDQKIDEYFIIEELEKLYKIADDNQIPLTFFEYITCLAFLYYDQQKVDFVALETGLGGKLDATNIIDTTILSVITSIALDHTSILGNSVQEIAQEKAGIIKPNIPVVIGPNAKPIQVFQDVAFKNKSQLYRVSQIEQDFNVENNNIAKEAINVLQQHYIFIMSLTIELPISQEAVQKGIEAKQLCRGQIIHHTKNPNCTVILDVGHNPNALSLQLDPNNIIVIYGTSSQKDAVTSIKIIAENSNSIFLVSAQHFRAMPIKTLQDNLQNLEGNMVNKIQTISDGSIKNTIEHVMNNCDKNTTVVICGSFFIMREASEALGQKVDLDPFELNEKMESIK